MPPWRKDQNGLDGIDDVLCSKINFGALLYGNAPKPLRSYVLSTDSVLPLQDVAWLQRYAVLSRDMLAFIHHTDDDRVIDYIPLAEIKEVCHSMTESQTCMSRQSLRESACTMPVSASCFETFCRSVLQVLVEEIEVNEEDILATSHSEKDAEEGKKEKKDYKKDKDSRHSKVSSRNNLCTLSFVLSAFPTGRRATSLDSQREAGRERQGDTASRSYHHPTP